MNARRSASFKNCVGRADGNEMASSQDIRLIARLAALKLTLLAVLVEFGTIVPSLLSIYEHHDPIIRWSVGVDPALPKMPISLTAVSNALKRSFTRFRIYFAWTRTARN